MKIKIVLFFQLICFASFGNQNIDLLNKYYELGVPSLSKSWSSDEYIKVMDIVINYSWSDQQKLPSSENNAFEIINKLSAYEDYWFYESSLYTNLEKMTFTVDFQKSLSKLMSIYISAEMNKGKKLMYSYEVSRCLIASLNIIDRQIKFTEVFMIEHPQLNDTQKEGLLKFKNGLKIAIDGALITIGSDYIYYDEKDLCAISSYFNGFYFRNRYVLDEDSSKEIDSKIKKIRNESKLDCVRKLSLTK